MVRYVERTRELLGRNGELLKKLSCPLRKQWNELQVVEVVDEGLPKVHQLMRFCVACERNVIDISGFDEDQVKAILAVQPDACLHVSSENRNISFESARPSPIPTGLPPEFRPSFGDFSCTTEGMGVPIIKTARTISAINHWISMGLKALIKPVEPSPEIREKYIPVVGRNGTVEVVTDLRDGFRRSYWFNPYRSPLPFAAYMIPPDLKEGERVFIPDLIEDIPAVSWNQGDSYRRTCGYAVWRESDLEIEPEPIMTFVG